MSAEEWNKPWRHPDLPGGRYHSTPSCADCEHFRVGGMPNRMCVQYPSKHIWALGYTPEQEREENGEVMAEVCPKWQLSDDVRAT